MITLSPMSPYDIRMLRRMFPQYDLLWGQLDMADASSVAVTAYTDEHAFLAAGGIHQIGEQYGYCWLVVTPLQRDLEPQRLALFYAIRRVFIDAYLKHGYRRLEAHVSVNDHTAFRLLQALGFQREGRLRRFFNNSLDAYVYGWIEDATR